MAKSYEFVTLDVFTGRRFGGNPLAVVADARGLDTLSPAHGLKRGNQRQSLRS